MQGKTIYRILGFEWSTTSFLDYLKNSTITKNPVVYILKNHKSNRRSRGLKKKNKNTKLIKNNIRKIPKELDYTEIKKLKSCG